MKSLTQDYPKPMLPLDGKPMLAHQVERLEKAGITEILIITGYKREIVEQYFSSQPPAKAQLSYQAQVPQNGTGSAALLARNFAGDEPFILTYGDVLVDAEVYRTLAAKIDEFDAVLTVKEVDDPHRGGAVYIKGDRVEKIVEKPPKGSSTTQWVNAGVYCFRPSVFDELERLPLSPRGEYELTDAVTRMLARGRTYAWAAIYGFWRDIGRPEDLPVAEQFVAEEGKPDG